LRDAHGAPKQRLMRRGAVLGGSLVLLAAMLGTGLAAAQPPSDDHAGIAQGDGDGSKIDPCALAQLQGITAPAHCGTTTSQSVASTTTIKPRTTTTVKGVKPPVTTTTVKPGPGRVLAIGDSVMLGARRALANAVPGIAIDAAVSRQAGQAEGIMNGYKNMMALPGTLVLHLGTNGRLTGGIFDGIMRAAQGRQVYWLTARVPRTWEAETNASIHAGLKTWKNAHALEWRDYAGCHDNWFVRDGFHLTDAGQAAYGQFIKDGLAGHAPTKCVK
jgi:hypothetical protein